MRRAARRIIIIRTTVEPSRVDGVDTVLPYYCISVLVEPASGARCTYYHLSPVRLDNPRVLDK